MATPAKAFALEPPLTASVVSTSFPPKRLVTVSPAGLAVSSLIAVSVAVAELMVGASLTALTVTSTVLVLEENAVEPPVLAVLTLVQAPPPDWSQARIVRAEVTAVDLLKLAFGAKKT